MTDLKLHNSQGPLSVNRAQPQITEQQSDETQEVAQKFEALLLFTMMKSMRASVSKDSLTGSDQQDLYREMMDREIANTIAASGGLGIQQMLERQLNSTNSGAVSNTNELPSHKAGLQTNLDLMNLSQQLKLVSG